MTECEEILKRIFPENNDENDNQLNQNQNQENQENQDLHLEHLLITGKEVELKLLQNKEGVYNFIFKAVTKNPRWPVVQQIASIANELIRDKLLNYQKQEKKYEG